MQLARTLTLACLALTEGRPPQAVLQAHCPVCKAPLEPEQDECPACAQENTRPPSTWTLLRLWRFARPYQGQLLAGFLLTLASTAATLVPPYLTMPLMDKVLIPYQSGKAVAFLNDYLKVFVALFGVVSRKITYHLSICLYHGKGSAQVVGDIRHKVTAHGIDLCYFVGGIVQSVRKLLRFGIASSVEFNVVITLCKLFRRFCYPCDRR